MDRPIDLPFFPPQASSVAADVDLLFAALTANWILFMIAVFMAVIWLVVKYRKGQKADRTNPPVHSTLIEIIWTVVPLIIAMGLFGWGVAVFLNLRNVPHNAMQIEVVGKQWMWKLQHPEGRWENNELHIPVGRPIKLLMTSEDVIHAFFIPAFRVKMDVIPGRYTKMWFTATKVGSYPLYCAEFCGTLHSQMTGVVHVMEPADYEAWLREGSNAGQVVAAGERLFHQHGCSGCHGPNSSVRAPMLDGIFGKTIAVQTPKGGVPLEQVPAHTIVADHVYLHDSILLPEKEVAAGFRPIMPTYKNRLSEADVLKILSYLRSQGGNPRTERREPTRTSDLSETEYRARTGFTPDNLDKIQSQAAGR